MVTDDPPDPVLMNGVPRMFDLRPAVKQDSKPDLHHASASHLSFSSCSQAHDHLRISFIPTRPCWDFLSNGVIQHRTQYTSTSANLTSSRAPPPRSAKRTGSIQIGQGSPPMKKPRAGTRSMNKIPSCESSSAPLSPKRPASALPTSAMLYGLSDADLPGTPPEMSPHAGQTVHESAREDEEFDLLEQCHTGKAGTADSSKDFRDVGTPHGSPPCAHIPSIDTIASSRKSSNRPTEDIRMALPSASNTELPILNGPISDIQHIQLPHVVVDYNQSSQILTVDRSLDPCTPPSVAIMEGLRAKLLASRKQRPSPVPAPASALALTILTPDPPPPSFSLEQNLRAQLKSRRGLSPANPCPAGVPEELEDGQITTPPPEEDSHRPRFTLGSIKHPLPLKPDFYPMSAHSAFHLNPTTNPFTPALTPIPTQPTSSDALPLNSGLPTLKLANAKTFNHSHSQPVRTTASINLSPPVQSSPPVIAATPVSTLTTSQEINFSNPSSKESDSMKQFRDLKQREDKLTAELANKRALLKARHQIQGSTSRPGSLDNIIAAAPTLASSASSSGLANPAPGPAFDGAKRQDRPSAMDTFNSSEMLQSGSLPTASDVSKLDDSVPPLIDRELVDDFLTNLQQQFGASVVQSGVDDCLASQSDCVPNSCVPHLTIHDRTRDPEGVDARRRDSDMNSSCHTEPIVQGETHDNVCLSSLNLFDPAQSLNSSTDCMASQLFASGLDGDSLVSCQPIARSSSHVDVPQTHLTTLSRSRSTSSCYPMVPPDPDLLVEDGQRELSGHRSIAENAELRKSEELESCASDSSVEIVLDDFAEDIVNRDARVPEPNYTFRREHSAQPPDNPSSSVPSSRVQLESKNLKVSRHFPTASTAHERLSPWCVTS